MVSKPHRLHSGDTIGIAAPCSPVIAAQLKRGIDYLIKRGFRVKLGEHIFDRNGYLAGNDTDRLNDLHAFFSDPNIKAIVLARGGYGCSRLLDLIDYICIKENPKIFVGYSDATALQFALLRKADLVTFSGPMVATDFGRVPVNRSAEAHFWALVKKDGSAKRLYTPNAGRLEVLFPGNARGPLIAGCLSVITGCVGTRFCPEFDGAILALEDVGEEPYKLDRAVTTLKNHGVFEKISGLILGQFVHCQSSRKRDKDFSIEDIIKPIALEYNIPSMMNLSYGHIPEKLTLPLGVTAAIDTSEKTFMLLEDAVN